MTDYETAGYKDGYFLKPMMFERVNTPAYEEYYKGWVKGKEDREFIDSIRYRNVGIAGGFWG